MDWCPQPSPSKKTKILNLFAGQYSSGFASRCPDPSLSDPTDWLAIAKHRQLHPGELKRDCHTFLVGGRVPEESSSSYCIADQSSVTPVFCRRMKSIRTSYPMSNPSGTLITISIVQGSMPGLILV